MFLQRQKQRHRIGKTWNDLFDCCVIPSISLCTPWRYTVGNRNREAAILDTSSRPQLVCWRVPLSGFVCIPISWTLENLRKVVTWVGYFTAHDITQQREQESPRSHHRSHPRSRPVSQIRAPPGGLSRTSGKLWQDYSNCYMIWT